MFPLLLLFLAAGSLLLARLLARLRGRHVFGVEGWVCGGLCVDEKWKVRATEIESQSISGNDERRLSLKKKKKGRSKSCRNTHEVRFARHDTRERAGRIKTNPNHAIFHILNHAPNTHSFSEALATQAAGEVQVTRHRRDALGVQRAQVRVRQQRNHVRLSRLLHRAHRRRLPAQPVLVPRRRLQEKFEVSGSE